MELSVVSLPQHSLAFTNCVYIHFDDFMALINQTPKGLVSKEQIKRSGLNIAVKNSVFAVKPLNEISQGSIGMGSLQRQTASVAMNESVKVGPFTVNPRSIIIATISFELLPLARGALKEAKVIDCEEVTKMIQRNFVNQVFATGQILAADVAGNALRLKVNSFHIVQGEEKISAKHGIVIAGSSCTFTKAKDAMLKLTNQSGGGSKAIFKPDFDFSKLGIGGLDNEFNEIFRRAFASRVFPPKMVQQMGITHVRGMLLFGPPGCGKTLIARQIGKVLNAKEPKVVNGPEILDKFVGESERKIRDLFADARQEQEENGDDSDLHIIIFDEIDAICKQRGSSTSGTGVGDSVVNQLLTQIDGVDSLNNVLVIGMTNRKDMIDEALMRPGRLEVQMEINLPDVKGRGQILRIHTEKSRENGFLDKEVLIDIQSGLNGTDIGKPNLAERTKNFSGAEIAGLVRAATAHALSRGTDGKTFHALQNFKPSIMIQDFDLALKEVKPKFGSPIDSLGDLYRNGIINYGEQFINIQNTLRELVEQVRSNEQTSLLSVLLHGESGTGKTALAASSAVSSEFPLVRLISAANFIGMHDSERTSQVFRIFQEAYRSPLSIIIIDDMERLIDYVALGPRFSNPMLQALLVMIKNPPPVAERKLLIVGITSSYDELLDIGLVDVFDVQLELQKLSQPNEIETVLEDTGVPVEDMQEIVSAFAQPIAVKKLLMIIELARQDADMITASRVIDCMYKFKM